MTYDRILRLTIPLPMLPLAVYSLGLARFEDGYPLEVLSFQLLSVVSAWVICRQLRRSRLRGSSWGFRSTQSNLGAKILFSPRTTSALLAISLAIIVFGYRGRLGPLLSLDLGAVRTMHWSGEGQDFFVLKIWSLVNVWALVLVIARLCGKIALTKWDQAAVVLLLGASFLDSLLSGGKQEFLATLAVVGLAMAWRNRTGRLRTGVIVGGALIALFVMGTHYLRLAFLDEYMLKFTGRLMQPGPTFMLLSSWVDPLILVKLLEPLLYFLDGVVAYQITDLLAGQGGFADYWMIAVRPVGGMATGLGYSGHTLLASELSAQFLAYGIGENPWIPWYAGFSVYLPAPANVVAFGGFLAAITLRASNGIASMVPTRWLEGVLWYVAIVFGTFFNPTYVPFLGNLLLALIVINSLTVSARAATRARGFDAIRKGEPVSQPT